MTNLEADIPLPLYPRPASTRCPPIPRHTRDSPRCVSLEFRGQSYNPTSSLPLPLQATHSHFNPLPLRATHSHFNSPTPTSSYPLPLQATHSNPTHPLPPQATHSHPNLPTPTPLTHSHFHVLNIIYLLYYV